MASSNGSPRVLIMGCGGLGGVIAASLFERQQAVFPVSRNAQVVDAVGRAGFRLEGSGGRRHVPGRVYGSVPADQGPFDFVVLATQPVDVEEAARQAAAHLAPGGRVVCLQNGLCEQRVADVLGDASRILGCVVAWGASMTEPGVFVRTSSGGFVCGRLDGEDDPALAVLASLLRPVGPFQETRNLAGVRWSKLALSCVFSTLSTISGQRLGSLVRQRFIRRLALEIITEVVAVAQHAGIRLEKVAGTLDLGWIVLTERDRQRRASLGVVAKHGLLLAVGLRFRRLRSSMLAAVESGRKPSIDFLNGEIVRRARTLNLPTPINAGLVDLVWQIARGEQRPHPRLLRELYDGTR